MHVEFVISTLMINDFRQENLISWVDLIDKFIFHKKLLDRILC